MVRLLPSWESFGRKGTGTGGQIWEREREKAGNTQKKTAARESDLALVTMCYSFLFHVFLGIFLISSSLSFLRDVSLSLVWLN